MFSCELCDISKDTFFTEHLCATASVTDSSWQIMSDKKQKDCKTYLFGNYGLHDQKNFVIRPFWIKDSNI